MKRRDLLTAAAPLILPRSVWGANDKLTYGIIGTGNRGGGLHKTFQKAGAQCLAVCDTYAPYMERALNDSTPGTKAYADYHDLIAHPGLDFIIVATPDHQHRPMLYAALDAKKDVYLEKPFSMSLEESPEMVARVRKTDRIVQVGMQRRSMPFIKNAKKVIENGVLGRVSIAKAMWNWHFDVPLKDTQPPGKLDWDRFQGPARHIAFEPRRFWWWRGFWEYSGGNMTDQGTHLMDVVQWLTGNTSPKSAVCSGYKCNAKNGDVPDVFSAVFEYPEMMATWTLNYASSYEYDWSITLQGEEAAMFIDRRGYRIVKDGGASAEPWSKGPGGEVLAEMPDKDPGDLHQRNFLECVRSRQQPNCTVEIAAAAVAGPHMANLAYRQGRKIMDAMPA